MPGLKLKMSNRTKFDLIFRYNDVDYHIPVQRSEETVVEAGYHLPVCDPHYTWVTKSKREVEGDLFVCVLEKDTHIYCNLVGWQ